MAEEMTAATAGGGSALTTAAAALARACESATILRLAATSGGSARLAAVGVFSSGLGVRPFRAGGSRRKVERFSWGSAALGDKRVPDCANARSSGSLRPAALLPRAAAGRRPPPAWAAWPPERARRSRLAAPVMVERPLGDMCGACGASSSALAVCARTSLPAPSRSVVTSEARRRRAAAARVMTPISNQGGGVAGGCVLSLGGFSARAPAAWNRSRISWCRS